MKYVFLAISVLSISSTSVAADVAAGKTKFQQMCASCHGATGKGDGVAAASLNPKPRNLSDAAYMKTRSDAVLKAIIMNGGAANGKSAMMPPWKASLSPADVDNLIAYIRSLAK
ncbi:MAG: hypothetical protein COV45_01340 [Deltaproteobacteria bacterium CG11_big_fil_rev_8_21_14_0_20_47_16]|nr:MAG: hypothetical protein COV45_01340 [Deltaproteobacteria bacterium CG11_big_fil_rev_8_21_14_0_20_47_16]